jgi:hypothetical protein
MNNLVIERIESSTLNHTKINNNNLPKDPLDQEALSKDYTEEVGKTHLDNYYQLVNYPVKFTFEFTEYEAKILLDAGKICTITSRRTELYKEELEFVEARLSNHWVDGKYFIRFNSCSTKDGVPRAPLLSPTDVIDSIITSDRAIKAIHNGDRKLYFVDFDDLWQESHEVRVFVRNGNVTCISQYNPYKAQFFNSIPDVQLSHITNNIINYVRTLVITVCPHIRTTDFVADLYVEDDFTIKLVELNSFGYWLASGSALFNWNDDRGKLYGDGKIYFRILI